jgi:hypothetical protein
MVMLSAPRHTSPATPQCESERYAKSAIQRRLLVDDLHVVSTVGFFIPAEKDAPLRIALWSRGVMGLTQKRKERKGSGGWMEWWMIGEGAGVGGRGFVFFDEVETEVLRRVI